MVKLTITPHRAAMAVLLAATAIAYANSFWGTFQFDDVSILQDPHLENLTTFFSHLGHSVRPFLKITFFLDRRLFGESPAGYHLLNFLLHLGCGFLIYKILLKAWPHSKLPVQTHSLASLPLWTALLFLIHPLQTEAVTYISGRATGLMAFFYLASLYLYLCATESDHMPKSLFLYLGSLLCFIFSLLSKEVAITLPAGLLLYEMVVRRRQGTERRKNFLCYHLPFWLILLLFLLMGWFHSRYSYLFHYSLGIRPVYENLLTQVNTVAYALSLFFAPGHLNFDHDLPTYHSIVQWPTPLFLVILSGMIAAAFLFRRRNRLLAFGLFWFFLHLIPTNSLIPRNDLLSDRNLYLPSIGLLLAIVSFSISISHKIKSYLKKWPSRAFRIAHLAQKAMIFIPLLISLFLLLSTIDRNAVYKDQVSFWSDAVRKSPHKARPHNNLGYAYYVKGDLDRAIKEFRIALSIDRYFPRAQQNLLKAWNLKKTQFR